MIHASLVSGMLDGDMRNCRPARRETSALVVLVAGLIAVFALPWRRPVASVVGIAAIAAAVVGVALFFWFRLKPSLRSRRRWRCSRCCWSPT